MTDNTQPALTSEQVLDIQSRIIDKYMGYVIAGRAYRAGELSSSDLLTARGECFDALESAPSALTANMFMALIDEGEATLAALLSKERP